MTNSPGNGRERNPAGDSLDPRNARDVRQDEQARDEAERREPQDLDAAESVAPLDAAPIANTEDSAATLAAIDEVPVPVAMTAAELDERAQVIEALRKQQPRRERDPDTGFEA